MGGFAVPAEQEVLKEQMLFWSQVKEVVELLGAAGVGWTHWAVMVD